MEKKGGERAMTFPYLSLLFSVIQIETQFRLYECDVSATATCL